MLLFICSCSISENNLDDSALTGKLVVSVKNWKDADFENVYEIGPGKQYATPNDFPWESVNASTLIKIHYRKNPYKSKWVITARGSKTRPVVVLGIPDNNGNLPVISGKDATTRTELNFWNEDRAVIKLGGSSKPAGSPTWVYIQALDIRSGRKPFKFTNCKGNKSAYIDNASSIFIESGENIFINNCIIHDSNNGLFASSATKNIRIAGNYIYDNGKEGSYYQHNVYTESNGIIFEYNYFGSLRENCGGNNLKDRSCGTVIRYNWIKNGNYQLDLVDSSHSNIYNNAFYKKTYVYGNILIESENQGNTKIVHYGGDSSKKAQYRNGNLYFYNNTVISTRKGSTGLMGLSNDNCFAYIYNNIFYCTKGNGALSILEKNGSAIFKGNWIQANWKKISYSGGGGSFNASNNVEESDPRFTDFANEDFTLKRDSSALNKAQVLGNWASSYEVKNEYKKHQQIVERPSTNNLGAFE